MKDNARHNEVEQEYLSWEPVLKQHLKEIHSICNKIYRNAGLFGVPKAYSQMYLEPKIIQMIEEVTEHAHIQNIG
jgi:hypothetical protein